MAESNGKGWGGSLWDSLSSVRLTIPLLIILAVASIFGTVIPQNASPEDYLQIYKVPAYRILRILGFLDMYHAKWFLFLLGLLSLNLVACSLRRLRSVLRFFLRPEIRLEEVQWKGKSIRRIRHPVPREKSFPLVQDLVSRHWGRIQVGGDGSYQLFAEKGKISRLGFYFIHLSILVILAGALIGLYFGFRGYVNLVEGESANQATLRTSQGSIPLGFGIRLDKFTVSFYPSGAPQEFKSVVTILENGQAVLTRPIRVNHPFTHKGISFYQASYGVADVDKVVLSIRDRTRGRELTVPTRIGTRTSIEGTSASFALTRFLPDFQGAGPAFQVVLSEPDRAMETFWILQRHPELEAGRKGPFQFTVKEMEARYYSGLQVTRDPGVPVVWAGCILLVIGFFISFFTSHRRVWVRLREEKGGTTVEIAGSSHRNRIDFEKEMGKLEQSLGSLFPGRRKGSGEKENS